MSTRYHGKPFLRVLELYILWAIDELASEDAEAMAQMTPKLQQIYRKSGTWQDIVVAEMEFPPDMARHIAGAWHKNKALAEASKEHLLPEDFAQMFADANWSSR